MHANLRGLAAALLVFLSFVGRGFAADTVSLTSATGAVATFTKADTGWKWTSLAVPGRTDVQALDELGFHLVTPVGATHLRTAPQWNLTETSPDRLVFEQEFPTSGIALRRIYRFAGADNVLRLETWARSLSGTNTVAHTTLLSTHVIGRQFRETGIANQSFPMFTTDLFVGIEHVSGECHAWDEVAYASQSPQLPVTTDWKLVATVVVGWPVPNADIAPGMDPVRAAFLRYLDTVRLKPKDLELHTNTWWTLPLPFSEQDVLRDLDALKQGFYDRTGMFFDSYALDLGWSSRFSIWRVDEQRFPSGFRNIVDKLGAMNCKLGLWISPGSAYPEGLDNAWLRASGYEVTPGNGPAGVHACFAEGTKYQQAVKDSIVGYARQYGLGHVKLDYMNHTCDVASHGHPTGPSDSSFAIDTGLADVLDSLRAVNPNMALEPLVCGYPPSPWWTMHTPYMLGPDGDDVPIGRVPAPDWMESLITARDIAYRAHQEEWIMPTQALETFDIVVQCPGAFENMAVMAIGRGRWFISTYLKPDLMKPQDWDFLAGMVRWARANKQYLVNAQMFGGSPDKREAYGYLFHSPDKDIYCIRNPWMEQRTITLPVSSRVTVTRDLQMLYPRHATLTRVAAGVAAKVTLAPYETVLLETVPTSSKNKIVANPARPTATVTAPTAQWIAGSDGSSHYVWDGTVTVPDVSEPELYVLVQGDATVAQSSCQLTISGQAVTPTKSGSAGQFSAAVNPSPENWTWFRVPVATGTQTIHIDVAAPMKTATVGLYLRGSTTVYHDAPVAGVVAFPEYQPEKKAWSQAIASQKTYTLKAAKTR